MTIQTIITLIAIVTYTAYLVIWQVIMPLKKRSLISPIPFILLTLGILFLVLLLENGKELRANDWAQILLMTGLVTITAVYASSTDKMAKEMREQKYDAVRPAIDFKRDTSKVDTERQSLEVYAASSEDVSHGLSCILCNIGLGPAIDLRSFIQHPERGRLPWEFGTIESRGKTDRWILSISHESNRTALVACYEDIYGRTLKSSREVSIDKENHDWKLGRLKVVPVKK